MSLSQDRQKKDLSDEVALDENTAEPAAAEVAETDNAAEVITGMETEALEEESEETAKEDDAGNDEASSDTAEEHEVDFIQSSGLSKDGQMLYLVRWKGYSKEFDTWEPAESLEHAKKALNKFNKEVAKTNGTVPRSTPSRSQKKKKIVAGKITKSPSKAASANKPGTSNSARKGQLRFTASFKQELPGKVGQMRYVAVDKAGQEMLLTLKEAYDADSWEWAKFAEAKLIKKSE